jgi:addiction module HigA family antidote
MPMKTPPHPGKSILHDCIEPLGLSLTDAAGHLGVNSKELSDILDGLAPVTPEMSIRLYQAFGGSVAVWRRMQASYDLAQEVSREHGIKVKRFGNPLGEIGLPTATVLHPGLILLHECLERLGISIAQAARHLGVPGTELDDIVNCRAPLTPEMAIRLDQAFGGHAEKWYALQANYDVARASMECGHKIKVRRLWRQDPQTHEPLLLTAPDNSQ